MEDISYIHKEQYILDFGDYGKLLFEEASASECFDHSFSMQRDPSYITRFISEFITEHGHEEHPIQIDKIGIDKLYDEIQKRRFAEFFAKSEGKGGGETAPFYVILDVLAERVGDPYEFIEKRTWRQCMAVIQGSIYNKRSGTKDGDKANRDMMRKDRGSTEIDVKAEQAVQDAVAEYIKHNS